jgi:hypothetical protein
VRSLFSEEKKTGRPFLDAPLLSVTKKETKPEIVAFNFEKNIIESIQINGKDVLEATNGEIEIRGNIPVKKNSKIYRVLSKI